MKKLSNTEAELKKGIAYIKTYNLSRRDEYKPNKYSLFESCDSNAISIFRKYRNLNLYNLFIACININSVVIAHININSVRNKFHLLYEQAQLNADALGICETKIDDSSPNGQIQLKGFNITFRLDRNKDGDNIMISVREDIPTKIFLMDKYLCGGES